MTTAEIRADLRELMRLSTPIEAVGLIFPQGLPPILPTGAHCDVPTHQNRPIRQG